MNRSPRPRAQAGQLARDDREPPAASARQRGGTSRPLLVLVLAIQALLLFWRLDLLPAWTDEGHTLEVAPLAPGEIARKVAADVHPPVYFWLAHAWLQLPLPGTPLERLRALSGVFVLLTSLFVFRLWFSTVDARLRACFLLLWALQPCLLLYGRMARSYSLQMLVGTIAITMAAGYLREPSPGRRGFGLGAVLAALLYVHYVPGLALAGAVAIASLWRALRDGKGAPLLGLALVHGLAFVLYLPWLTALLAAAGKWAARPGAYRAFPSAGLDEAAKICYGFFSLSFGETPGSVGMFAGALLAPVLAWMLIREARAWAPSGLLPFAAAVVAIAFVGVSRWVSFPFVPARLLFLLPCYLLAVVAGARRGRPGMALCGALAAVYLLSIANYFGKSGFLNKGYAAPFDEMARLVRAGRQDSIVLIDTFNTDAFQIARRLEDRVPVILLWGEGSLAELERMMAESQPRVVWHIRNTHDVSPGRLNEAAEKRLAAEREVTTFLFQPYSWLERRLIRLAGWREWPTHFYQVKKFEKLPR